MQKITMFMMKTCPYCKAAMGYNEQLLAQHPEYRDIPFEMVDEREQAARAEKCDYYFVPTYYVGDKKMHEGAASPAQVAAVFAAAYKG
ncbi:MAG: hypothetical protein VB021_08685 [Oscillospiraceae bacterium]|nr:hypothetical protein [Oscillospiraceae bacterium]